MKRIANILFLGLLLVAGCTQNFDEINTNPNSPDRLANPGVLFTNVIRGAINNNFEHSYNRGSIAGDMIYNDFASNYNNWVRGDASGYFLWNYYTYIRDLNEIIQIAEEQGLNNYKGVALVLRSWMFQNLTDLYGPIPFREAANAKLQGINSPKYEQQQAVYEGLLADLEEANSLLGSSNENVVGDLLFGSDIVRWKKFSTGLMIRLLMRQSGKVDPSTALNKILDNPNAYPVFESHAEQAALQYIADTRGNAMPLFVKSNSDYATSTRVSKNLVDYLKLLDDPRLPVFALPTQASIEGTDPDPENFEYEGAINGNGPLLDPKEYSAPGMLWAPEQYNPSLASMNAAQGIILSYSEVQFNLAEAAEKGYIPGGSAAAEAHYRKGIEDQFAYYSGRVGSRYAASFLQLKGEDIIPDESYYLQSEVQYNGSTEEKLEKIALQKWLSLYLIGYEAWFEWRRTGFPEIVVGTQGPGYIARRALYPADEMRINEENYQQAASWLGGDELDNPVWWDK